MYVLAWRRSVVLLVVLSVLGVSFAPAVQAAPAPGEIFDRVSDLVDSKGKVDLLTAYRKYLRDRASSGIVHLLHDAVGGGAGALLGMILLGGAPLTLGAVVLVVTLTAIGVGVAELVRGGVDRDAAEAYDIRVREIALNSQQRAGGKPSEDDPMADLRNR